MALQRAVLFGLLSLQIIDSNVGLQLLSNGNAWPGGLIPYTFAHELTRGEISAIKAAMKYINLRSCVTFVPWTTENASVNFYRGFDCNNVVGRRTNGEQKVSLFRSMMINAKECAKPDRIRLELIKTAGGRSIDELNRLYDCGRFLSNG